MGGKPDILGGYFGVMLPAVFVDRRPLKSPDGRLLHFWLQEAIEPPFDMDDNLGITGCESLDSRIRKLVALSLPPGGAGTGGAGAA